MKTLLVLLLGAALGIGAYFYFQNSKARTNLEKAGDKISESAGELRDNWNKTVGEIDTNQIKEELSKTGRVVRKKAQEAGEVIADATADARMTTSIKSKYALDSDLSAMTISVNTTKGVVTLSGTVKSHEHIKKAMQKAIEVDGVTEVVSTLQVK